MARLDETAAALRFFGDDLDPDELTRLLGSSPTKGVKKGDIRFTADGTKIIAKYGSWRLKAADQSPGDLDAQICELFENLSADLTVWSDLCSRYQADIFCGLFLKGWNEGIDLQPSTLSAIGLRGLILGFDIYDGSIDD